MKKYKSLYIFIFSFFILIFAIPRIILAYNIPFSSIANNKANPSYQNLTENMQRLNIVMPEIKIPTITVPIVNLNQLNINIKNTPSFVPTVKPTLTAINTTAVTAIPKQTVLTEDPITFMMNAINSYRKSRGLYEVKTDSNTCNFARTRAQEISTNFSHEGFYNRINNKTLPYPSYSMVTENLALNDNYKNVVNAWINSPGHAANMEKDTPFVCVQSYGNYYAYEGWKP